MAGLKRNSRMAVVACAMVAIMNTTTGIMCRSEQNGCLYFYIAVMWLLIGFLPWLIVKTASTPMPRLDAWRVLAEYHNHTAHVCDDGLLVCEDCGGTYEDSVKFDAHAMRAALGKEEKRFREEAWEW